MPEEGSILAATTETAAPQADPPILGGTATPPAEGGKPEEGLKEGAEPPKEGEAAKPVVPEKYEFKAPDGMTLDTAAVEAFSPIARELGLSQDQAQKMVDLYSTQVASNQKAIADGWGKQQQDWGKELSGDKEFGGDAFSSTRNNANAVLSKFASKDEIQAIQAMGLGNFPPFVKMLARAGKAMGEDSFVRGAASKPDRSAEDVLYGDKNP